MCSDQSALDEQNKLRSQTLVLLIQASAVILKLVDMLAASPPHSRSLIKT